MSSYVTVVKDANGKGWKVVAKVYDSSKKKYNKMECSPVADRNTAVTEGRDMALNNKWQFIS